jgi:hypothetical protein
MGVTGDAVPDAAMRQVYEFEFTLLQAIIEDRLPTAALVPPPAAPPQDD